VLALDNALARFGPEADSIRDDVSETLRYALALLER
jgi:hypothetical protein